MAKFEKNRTLSAMSLADRTGIDKADCSKRMNPNETTPRTTRSRYFGKQVPVPLGNVEHGPPRGATVEQHGRRSAGDLALGQTRRPGKGHNEDCSFIMDGLAMFLFPKHCRGISQNEFRS